MKMQANLIADLIANSIQMPTDVQRFRVFLPFFILFSFLLRARAKRGAFFR